MFFGKSWNEWISQYSSSHQNRVNQLCHTIGIPMILVSLLIFVGAIFVPRLWMLAAALFVVGWIFQFVGHAFEGKRSEFFHDWRFLFVGAR